MMFVLIIGIDSHLINKLGVTVISELTLKQLKLLLIYVSSSAMIIYFSKQFFENLAQWVYDKLSEYGQIFIFNITKGGCEFSI